MGENGFNEKITVMAASTYAVTVTYGRRFKFLKHSVQAALDNGVGRVIIVDNASEPENQQAIQELEASSGSKVAVIVLPENRGSAGGYKTGLEYVHNRPGCEYIWLLDDDNVPIHNALEELLKQYCQLNRHTKLDRLALLALRDTSVHLRKVAEGRDVKQIFKKRSSFMRFHFIDFPNNLGAGIDRKRTQKSVSRPITNISIPYGSYGGLFFHKSLLSRIGFPDERLFLYCDDCEYTSRLTRGGGKLVLIPSSHIRDIEPRWSFEAPFPSVLTAGSDLRAYYAVRNNTYFDSHIWQESPLIYRLNKYIVYIVLFLFAIRYGKWKRLKLVFQAARDGEAGKLGRNSKL